MSTPSAPEVPELDVPVPALPAGERYRGGGLHVALDDLHPDDRAFLEKVYARLEGFYQLWRTDPQDPPWDLLADGVATLADPDLREEAQEFGVRTRAAGGMPRHMQRVLHDVRGGGLSAALAEAEMLTMGAPSPGDRPEDRDALQALVYLARDHAKMMRNAVLGIDPPARARDEEEQIHSIGDLIRRWDGQRYRTEERSARVVARADRDGGLSSCCLEASAVDRVLYNLIRNAARFAPDGQVAAEFRHVSDEVVRIAVVNRVAEEQASWLSRTLADDPGALYRSGVTRGGQGYGLANVAEFVTTAFGFEGTDRALELGLLGSRLVDDRFVTWFHWPAFPGG